VDQLRQLKQKDPRVIRAAIYTVVALFLTAAVYMGAQVAGREAAQGASKVIVAQDAKGCDRNQIQRVYDRVDEHGDYAQTEAINVLRETRIRGERKPPPLMHAPIIANRYFQIVNCGATYTESNTDGGPVYLQHPDEQCFIHLVTSGYFVRQAPTTDPGQLRRIC
jgi:hypothetical protein